MTYKRIRSPSKRLLCRDTSLHYLPRILTREAVLDYERRLDIEALGYDYWASHPT